MEEKYSKLFIEEITNRFSEKELKNILRKVKLATIRPNFKHILLRDYSGEYQGAEAFFEKYAGKTVNVYEWCGDWWICEDDEWVITEDCFDLTIK